MDFTSVLTKVLPWIGAAATGNVPALITMAAKEVGDVLGVEVKPEAGAIAAAVANATPEQMLALRDRELAFQERMQAMGLQDKKDMAALANENTKDARAMQIATRSPVPAVLAVLITLGFFGILVGMLAGWLKSSDNQALLIMLGALGAAWGAVVNYFFGSSADSGRKTELLAQAPPVGKG